MRKASRSGFKLIFDIIVTALMRAIGRFRRTIRRGKKMCIRDSTNPEMVQCDGANVPGLDRKSVV